MCCAIVAVSRSMEAPEARRPLEGAAAKMDSGFRRSSEGGTAGRKSGSHPVSRRGQAFCRKPQFSLSDFQQNGLQPRSGRGHGFAGRALKPHQAAQKSYWPGQKAEQEKRGAERYDAGEQYCAMRKLEKCPATGRRRRQSVMGGVRYSGFHFPVSACGPFTTRSGEASSEGDRS